MHFLDLARKFFASDLDVRGVAAPISTNPPESWGSSQPAEREAGDLGHTLAARLRPVFVVNLCFQRY